MSLHHEIAFLSVLRHLLLWAFFLFLFSPVPLKLFLLEGAVSVLGAAPSNEIPLETVAEEDKREQLSFEVRFGLRFFGVGLKDPAVMTHDDDVAVMPLVPDTPYLHPHAFGIFGSVVGSWTAVELGFGGLRKKAMGCTVWSCRCFNFGCSTFNP